MAAIAPAFDQRLVVVSARSPIELGPFSYAWFHVEFTPRGNIIDRDEAEAAWKHVSRFVAEVVNEYDTDPERTFIGGFSQGAIVSLAALLTDPEPIAGVIAMSGRLIPEVLPHAVVSDRLMGKPVLIIHGTDDEMLNVNYGRSARDTLLRFPLDLTYREFPMRHTTTDESLTFASSWLGARL